MASGELMMSSTWTEAPLSAVNQLGLYVAGVGGGRGFQKLGGGYRVRKEKEKIIDELDWEGSETV